MPSLRRRSFPVFFSLLICFIAVLILPIVTGSFVYRQINAMFRQRSIDAASFMLRQSALTFERFFEVSDNTVYALAVNPSVQSAARLDRPDFASKDILYFTALIGQMSSVDLTGILQSEMILFLKKPDAIVRHESVSFNIKQYYNTFLRYEDYDYDEWAGMILSQPLNRFFIPSKLMTLRALDIEYNKEFVAYVHSFPLLSSIVLIDSDAARSLLSESVISATGAALIMDRDGNVILYAGNGGIETEICQSLLSERDADGFIREIGGEQMIILTYDSPYNGLQYVSANPANEAMQDVFYLQRTAAVFVCAILIGGLSLSFFMSRQYTKPIREIIALLDKRYLSNGRIAGNLRTVRDNIVDLVTSNDELSVAVDNQTAISKNLFIDRLLNGMVKGQEEIDRFIEYFGMNLSGSCYDVLLIARQTDEEDDGYYIGSMLDQDVFKLAIDKILQETVTLNGYSHLVDNKTAALILCLEHEAGDGAYKIITLFLDELRDNLAGIISSPLTIGVGTVYRKLFDISFSFVEARIAMERAQSENSESTVWYNELDSAQKCGFYYPPDLEHKFINLVKMGKKDELLHNLHQIYKENFSNRSLVKNIQIQLFFEMRSTIIKILNEINSDADAGDIQHMDFSVTPEFDVLQAFTNTYVALCDSVNKNKKSHNEKLIEAILQSIDERYTDSNMSVDGLAGSFNISPAYFSRFFKEQTGEVFSGYIENKRINKACELLKETNWSIDKIAAVTGYNSAYSFRRAFKKKVGAVPTEYRK